MTSPARHLALPAPKARKTSTSSHKATKASKTRTTAKSLLGSAALLVTVVVLALTGTGTTYAMWNDSTTANASSVSSASTGLTINGSTAYTIPAQTLANLAPGQSVMLPLTLANTGTVKLNTTISSVAINSTTQGLANELTLRATQSSTCNATTNAGTHLATFTTTASPVTMAVGASVPLCLELKMDVDAPVTVAGGTATFTINLTAVQVRG